MDLNHIPLQHLRSLNSFQVSSLQKSGLKHAADLLLAPPRDLAKSLRLPPAEVHAILKSVSKELAATHGRWKNLDDYSHETFTTGDSRMDILLGGGIRTGMVWEVAGESSCGKSQLCMQLSLLVQLDPNLGGISGAACYITVGAKLPTTRLAQLQRLHPKLSPTLCSLSDVHTQSAPTIEVLLHLLANNLPHLQDSLLAQKERKPIRLVIVDSIASLFQTSHPQTSGGLRERSKALTDLSAVAHNLASMCNIAVVFVNDVSDVFNEPGAGNAGEQEIRYRDQSRWFNSAPFGARESGKEATLGLVWANHLNTRIMMSKTNKRTQQALSDHAKRPKLTHPSTPSHDSTRSFDDTVTIRNFTVIFSNVAHPQTIDFIISNAGIISIDEQDITTRTQYVEVGPSDGPATRNDPSLVNPQNALPSINDLEAWDGLDSNMTRHGVDFDALLDEEEDFDPLLFSM